jgi:hypothetical protein
LRRAIPNRWLIYAGVFIAFFALLTFANYRYTSSNPGGNDFLVHYEGTRSFLKEGLSPYSDAVALKIQNIAYGRPVQPGEHELRVAYPLYSMVLFAPFALVDDFNLARALWMSVLEISLILSGILSMRLMGWKPKFGVLIGFLIFIMLWYHGLRPLINGNAVIVVVLLITGGLLALKSGEEELAGVLFAFSTIKPQLVVLLLAYIVYWAMNRKKWKVIIWMVGTVAILSGAAALLIPDWLIQNLREVIRYPLYNPPGTIQAGLKVWFPTAGGRIGTGVTVVLGILLLFEWWLGRKAEGQTFFWVVSLTLVASQWIGIQTDPGNFIILLPALVLVFSLWENRMAKVGEIFTIASMVLLGVLLWVIFLATVSYSYQPIQSPVMFLPLPIFLFVTLYWGRWWVKQSQQLWYDQLYQKEH